MATSITATNKSPLIVIVVWLLLALATFAYVVRLIVKISRQALHIELDDALITGSLVFCIAQSVTTIVRADHGFGKPMEELPQANVVISLKAEQAANIFYIISAALARLSLLSLILKLIPSRRHQYLAFALCGFIIICSLVSIFVASFECQPPDTWAYTKGKCIDRVAWWIAYDIGNSLTEVILIVMPVYIIHLVQWPLSKKVIFSVPFTFRVCTVAAYIADIIVWKNFVGPSSDPFFAQWQVSVTTQVIQCSCLCTTCFLYLKNFLNSVETGFGLDYDLRSSGLELTTYNISSEGLTQLTQSTPVPKQSNRASRGLSGNGSRQSALRSGNSVRLR